MLVKKNDVLEVEILDLTYQAYGLAKVDGFSVFIENAIPGELVEIRIEKVLKRYAFGKLLRVLRASEHRVEVRDVIGTRIGTMPLQHLEYAYQLAYKKNQVEHFLSLNLESYPEVKDTLGMRNPWEYRNKAQVPVREIKGLLETGFFKRNSHDLIPIENFYIQDKGIDETLIIVRDVLRKYGIASYDEEQHKGLMRHIIVRKGHYTNELMIVLVTLSDILPYREEIIREILDQAANVVSIVLNINPEKTNVILGTKQYILFGEDLYYDELFGLRFAISSRSFFQINTPQTEVLYAKALEFAHISKEDIVVDAYCGIGTISLIAAQKAKHVYGVEIVEDAIAMANYNAKLNNIENVTFVAGAAEDIMPRWIEEGIEIDVLIVDPPRKGLDIQFIKSALTTSPKRIVYVSCNPDTLARDLKVFTQSGYSIDVIQPVDMFPQTTHVETVALLQREIM
jgi:23S rRNA (uracil1939-C5)-methyltransferase